jgi:hypothetical protein
MSETVIVDINNLDQYPDLDRTDLDLESDAFEVSPPPPPGKYQVKLGLLEGYPQLKQDRQGKGYYLAGLELTIVNSAEWDGAKAYAYVSTMIGRGKKISTMATLLVKGKATITKKNATQKEVLKDFISYLQTEPIQWVEMDWEVTYPDGEGNYKTLYSTYSDIPNGQTKFNVKVKDGVVIAYPRLKVKTWIGADAEPSYKPRPSRVAVAAATQTIEDLEKLLDSEIPF